MVSSTNESCPLVSCVIITHNRPDLVGQAIESVLNQSYENIEVIVVNDCSTKSYADVEAKYADRVIFTSTAENSGGCSTPRNTGIEHAKGKYIAFLDDDDSWLEDKTTQQVAALESANGRYVACSGGHIESVKKAHIVEDKQAFHKDDLLMSNRVGPPSKLMILASACRGIRFDANLKHAEDWDFYLQLTDVAPILYICSPLIIYNTSHHERMTNTFCFMTYEEIESKMTATIKNRAVIGEKNYQLRCVHYYFTGLKRRKAKLKHVVGTVKRTSLAAVITYLWLRITKNF